jgi:hypothetical protein
MTDLTKVRELRDAQAASVGTDPYMRGLYNGLELALAVTEDRDPAYLEGPVKTDALHSVIAERRRQIMVEGWAPAHDDEHKRGEMALAAACYAAHTATWSYIRHGFRAEGGLYRVYQTAQEFVGRMWPWAREWWKPKDERSNLVRAAALLIAEIERLDRAAGKARVTNGQHGCERCDGEPECTCGVKASDGKVPCTAPPPPSREKGEGEK